jgi:hypothetical protein
MGRNKLTPPEITINELLDRNSSEDLISSKEIDSFIEAAAKANLQLIARKSDSMTSSIVMFRKLKPVVPEPYILNIPNGKYEEWVEPLKEVLASNKDATNARNIWLVANDTAVNGVLGLANCLRVEPGGNHVRCIFDYDSKLPSVVDFDKKPFDDLRKLDLVFNVYKNGQWGACRHIILSEEQETIETEHAYLNVVTRGDMSSLKWFDAHHKYFPTLPASEKKEQEVLCNVYYSALNFKVNEILFYSHSNCLRIKSKFSKLNLNYENRMWFLCPVRSNPDQKEHSLTALLVLNLRVEEVIPENVLWEWFHSRESQPLFSLTKTIFGTYPTNGH